MTTQPPSRDRFVIVRLDNDREVGLMWDKQAEGWQVAFSPRDSVGLLIESRRGYTFVRHAPAPFRASMKSRSDLDWKALLNRFVR